MDLTDQNTSSESGKNDNINNINITQDNIISTSESNHSSDDK